MSNSNNNRKAATRQANASHYEQSRAYAKQGFHNSAVKAAELLQNPPTSSGAAAMLAARTAWAGRKEYGKSIYHAGMGFMQGISRQFPNSGQQLNNIRINQSLAQGRQQSKINQAKQLKQNSQYKPNAKLKTNQPAVNKGIEGMRNKSTSGQQAVSRSAAQTNQNKGITAAQQKSSAKQTGTNAAQASKSSNKGISSYQSKASGQTASASRGNSPGATKGTSASSGKSGGGKSSGSSKGR